MAQPSKRALRAALLAPECAIPQANRADILDESTDIVAMTHALKERIGVLQILDGTAPEWPGIHACTESLVELAQEVSQQLNSSRELCDKVNSDLRAKQAEVSVLQGQLAESCDALRAAEADNSILCEEQQQLTERFRACQESLEQQRSKHEAKVGTYLGLTSRVRPAPVPLTLFASCLTMDTGYSLDSCVAALELPLLDEPLTGFDQHSGLHRPWKSGLRQRSCGCWNAV